MTLSDDDVRRLRLETVSDDTFGSRFSILGETASGGTSRVFEAMDNATGERVAIKLLLGGEDRVRFAAEAEILEALDHPAIVRYIRHGENRDGVPYLATEWLTGETLSKRLQRQRPTTLEATELAAQLAAALAYLHGRGVIHRDLKPSNIYLVGDRAKLIDLGIAKVFDHDLTQTGQIVGTPGYMAPEQARGDRAIDARADLFALGCVLYEMLAGRPPFEGTAVMEVLARLLLQAPPPFDGPPRLVKLVDGLLEKDPRDRISDAATVLAELTAIQGALHAGDHRALARSALPPRTEAPTVRGNRRRSRRWLWIAGTLAAAGVVAALLARPEDAPCTSSDRSGCEASCGAGSAASCSLWAESLDDKRSALAAFERGRELGDASACTRGVAIIDALLRASQLPGDQAAAAIGKSLQSACDRGDLEACLDLAIRHTPDLGSLPPDAALAHTLAVRSCKGGLAAACNHLASMIESDVGDDAQRKEARAVRDDACWRGIVLCPRGSLEVSSTWASVVVLDDDETTRSNLPHAYYIPSGLHRLTYIKGDQRCDAQVKVMPNARVKADSSTCERHSQRPGSAKPRAGTTTAPGGDEGEDANIRLQVDKLASMQGEYVDPCWPEGKIQHYGAALDGTDTGAAARELARYRNVLSCKHIKVQLVPNSGIESEYHRAVKRGDTETAKQKANQLYALAKRVVVDRALVERRLRALEAQIARFKIREKHPQLGAMLDDARAELAAGRIESANLVANHLLVRANDVSF